MDNHYKGGHIWQLAQLLSVSRQAVSRWESELSFPETERILMLSERLNVSCDYLLRGNETARVEFQNVNPVTKLLLDAVGKQIKITFYGDAQEYELIGKNCVILSFDGNWANIDFIQKKNHKTKLIPISSILSITYMEED